MKTTFKKNILSIGWLGILLICLNVNSTAQVATANPYQNIIKVGESLQLDLKVVAPKGAHVSWPALDGKINENIEIFEALKIDTLTQDTLGYKDATVLKQSLSTLR